MGKERQIAYLWVPDFGTAVARRADPKLEGRPLVLLDEHGRVLAADALAGRAGVVPGVTERQAAARCPDAVLAPAAAFPLWEAQERFVERVKGYADRWQPDGVGRAFLDATGFAGSTPPQDGAGGIDRAAIDRDLLGWCQALAGAVRGLGWGPAVGVTGSKFGAGVAGQVRARQRATWPGRTPRCCWRRPRNGPSWPANR